MLFRDNQTTATEESYWVAAVSCLHCNIFMSHPISQDEEIPECKRIDDAADAVAFDWNRRDWPTVNRRRGQLIDKEIAGTITSSEAAELAGLQAYADYHLEKVAPRPTHVLEELETRVFG